MRILGFILIFVLAIPNITLQRRLPPKKVRGGLVNLAAFKSLPYTVYTLSAVVAFLGLYTGIYSLFHFLFVLIRSRYSSPHIHRHQRNPSWRLSRLLFLPCLYNQRCINARPYSRRHPHR